MFRNSKEERKKKGCNSIFVAQLALLVISSLSLYLSSKCLDHPTPASYREHPLTKCQHSKTPTNDHEKHEAYFKRRFVEEMRNLLTGNETEFVTQMNAVQREQLAVQRKELEDQWATTISVMEQKIHQCENDNHHNKHGSGDDTSVLFPSNRVGKYMTAMARVPRESFQSLFAAQFGGPFMESYPGARDLTLIYSSPDTPPRNFSSYNNKGGVGGGTNAIPWIEDMGAATENCDQLHVVFTATETSSLRQCLALVPNYESFHVHQLSRPSAVTDAQHTNVILNHTAPLRLVPRSHRIMIPAEQYPIPRYEKDTRPFFQ